MAAADAASDAWLKDLNEDLAAKRAAGAPAAEIAVLEAAILASRTAFLPPEGILRQLDDLQVLVDKTGAEPEQRAFSLLRGYVEKAGERQADGDEAR